MLLEFINKSIIRPGVQITTSGLFLKAVYCFYIEDAPITNMASSFVYLLSFENY